MEINYSSLDTISEYEFLFTEFICNENEYCNLNDNRKLIDFSAGLGLTNSIHEKFVKSIFKEYKFQDGHNLSKTQYDRYTKKYKSPKKIKEFANLFNLDLNTGYNLLRNEIQLQHPFINSLDNLLNVICEQRDIRNDYLHGDFEISLDIVYSTFNENVVDFQNLHNYILKIFRYSFMESLNELPDLPNYGDKNGF